MKYRHKTTGEIVEATQSTTRGSRPIPGGEMWLDVDDLLVERADGTHEGYAPSHPFWADYDEVVQTRVVKVDDDAGTRYFPERLTATGWVRGAERATQKAAESAVVSAPKLTVVKAFEGGEAKAELVAGDDPSTPEVETSWWRKVLAIVGIATDAP